MISEDWLNDPIITEWFTIIKNPRTQENYRREFPYFLAFVKANTEYKTPSQMIESRIEQLRSPDMNVKRYWESVGIKYMHSLEEKGYRRSTIITYLRTMLSFFSHAHVKFEYARKELIGAVEPNESEKIIKEWIASNEDLRILYRVSQSSRDKAILLTLYQSGLSSTDVCALKIQHFNFYDNEGKWKADSHQYLCKLREKTNIRQQTFLSVECVDELKIYLQNRGYPQKGYLFLSVHNKQLSPRDINDIVKGVVSNAFPKRTEWKTKNLRDSFMNALVKAKIPTEIKNLFVGHIRPNAQKDYDYTEDTLRPLYEDTFKFLSINGVGSHDRKLEELEKTLKTTMAENQEAFNKTIAVLTEKVGSQENEIQKLNHEMDKREKTFKAVVERVDDLTEFLESWVEFSDMPEDEKEYFRKRFGLEAYPIEERQLYESFLKILREVKGTKKYLTEEEKEEVGRRIKAMMDKTKA